MKAVHLIALLALVQMLFFGVLVGRARAKHGVKAPAITGAPEFERMYRVQMNTIEQVVVFLPALYIAAQFFPGQWVAAVGVVYLIGRFVYWHAYVRDPAGRGLGFLLTVIPSFILIAMGFAGIVLR